MVPMPLEALLNSSLPPLDPIGSSLLFLLLLSLCIFIFLLLFDLDRTFLLVNIITLDHSFQTSTFSFFPSVFVLIFDFGSLRSPLRVSTLINKYCYELVYSSSIESIYEALRFEGFRSLVARIPYALIKNRFCHRYRLVYTATSIL